MTSEEELEVSQPSSFVGEWIETMCDFLLISPMEISEGTEISKSTMFRIIRGESSPSWESAEAILTFFIQVAAQKRILFSPLMWEAFLNAAGFVSEAQKEIARNRLDMLQDFTRMQRKLAEKDQQIAQMAEQLGIPIEDGVPQIKKRRRRSHSLDN